PTRAGERAVVFGTYRAVRANRPVEPGVGRPDPSPQCARDGAKRPLDAGAEPLRHRAVQSAHAAPPRLTSGWIRHRTLGLPRSTTQSARHDTRRDDGRRAALQTALRVMARL